MSNPYATLPANAFWRSAVSERRGGFEDLWRARFPIDKATRIVTAGSCFAQHISRALRQSGYTWVDSEPAPWPLGPQDAERFGYGVFSFRTGNIYTTALLRQWIEWALGRAAPADEVWQGDGGRYFDPFRPTIEPGGFQSPAEVTATRNETLKRIAASLRDTDLFVFTFGLTEGWWNRKSGHAYPMCPGTAAGVFDADEHEFHNASYPEIMADVEVLVELLRSINPAMRFLFTVSPVPLTATAAGEHVLVATTHSKSVLRAVAGELAKRSDGIDYFPSYEIISSFPSQGRYYDPNMRTVTAEGVETVMGHFFAGLGGAALPRSAAGASVSPQPAARTDDPICDDILLEAFATPSR